MQDDRDNMIGALERRSMGLFPLKGVPLPQDEKPGEEHPASNASA
ncbi:MAG TPA: hypothetical protein VHZ51_17400 [Ktedonobacteraceae bacterium]|jgi:hypothetical protein|nr:hypothetical protein [Ktedonobacteraceae bacterium]